MPKVRAKAVANLTEAESSLGGRLKVHYCICGEFFGVLDRSLDDLPRRRTDGAYILRNIDSTDGQHKKRTYKLNCKTDEKAVLIRRGDAATQGLEKQYRLRCMRCDLPIGYETADPRAVKRGIIKAAAWTYLIPGGLTETQSTVPDDAFDLEPGKTFRNALALEEAQAAAEAATSAEPAAAAA